MIKTTNTPTTLDDDLAIERIVNESIINRINACECDEMIQVCIEMGLSTKYIISNLINDAFESTVHFATPAHYAAIEMRIDEAINERIDEAMNA